MLFTTDARLTLHLSVERLISFKIRKDSLTENDKKKDQFLIST